MNGMIKHMVALIQHVTENNTMGHIYAKRNSWPQNRAPKLRQSDLKLKDWIWMPKWHKVLPHQSQSIASLLQQDKEEAKISSVEMYSYRSLQNKRLVIQLSRCSTFNPWLFQFSSVVQQLIGLVGYLGQDDATYQGIRMDRPGREETQLLCTRGLGTLKNCDVQHVQ